MWLTPTICGFVFSSMLLPPVDCIGFITECSSVCSCCLYYVCHFSLYVASESQALRLLMPSPVISLKLSVACAPTSISGNFPIATRLVMSKHVHVSVIHINLEPPLLGSEPTVDHRVNG